jgi:hypothetical protein
MLSMIAVLAVAGCSYITPLDPGTSGSWLPFIIEGRTTKEEALNRLGMPVNQYEEGRIITYILRQDLNGRFQVGSTGLGRSLSPEVYNLVLVFGPTEILEKYSLLRVR